MGMFLSERYGIIFHLGKCSVYASPFFAQRDLEVYMISVNLEPGLAQL
jgi:hypothetical protein